MHSQAAKLRSGRFTLGNFARLEVDNLEHFGVYRRLIFQDSTYTNLEEMQRAGALAALLKSYGVGPGDRVLVMMPNSPELSAAFQAVWIIGAVVVPVMSQWLPEEVMDILRSAEPKVALTLPPWAPRIEQANAAIGTLQHLLVFGASEAPRGVDIEPELLGAKPITSPQHRAPSDLAVLLYTSGTTGAPKGVMLTHQSLMGAVESTFRQNPEPRPGIVMQPLPLAHVFGNFVQSMANCWGWTTVLLRQFDPVLAFQEIERHRINYLPVVPTMLVYLVGHSERPRFNLSSVSQIISGGAALPERLRLTAEKVFGCPVYQGYGLSESAAAGTGYDWNLPYRPGSAGLAAPGIEVSIRDDANKPLPTCGVGEVCLVGANVMAGYWADPEASRNTLVDGCLHTGDLGYLDEDGYLFITDRKKDLIIKGGENVSPRELEEMLNFHPAVLESAVVGVPDPVYGENIHAVVQLKPGAQATEEQLLEHVAKHVTKFKVPAGVTFIPMLPRNSAGKILKRQIRAQLLNKTATPI